MSRYTGPRWRITRRLGPLPGFVSSSRPRRSWQAEKRQSQPPGQHGPKQAWRYRRKKRSKPYGVRLAEKQKLRFHYGVGEKQLINYVKQAKKVKGSAGQALLQLLEMRLDNILFRLGLARTIAAARQMVSHKHVNVNSSCVSIPSYQCRPGDTLSLKDGIEKRVREVLGGGHSIPKHLRLDQQSLVARILGSPYRREVPLRVNELFVMEHYSRKI